MADHASLADKRFIDHLLFRKLFSPSFSDDLGHEYLIAEEGVRWHETESDLLTSLPSSIGPSDPQIIAMLEIIREARLDFPASPKDVLLWVERSADTWTFVPEWLKQVLHANTVEEALDGLRLEAGRLEEASASASASEAGDREEPGTTTSDLAEIALAIDAYECVQPSVRSVGAAGSDKLAKSHTEFARSGGIAKRDKNPKTGAKQEAFKFWQERHQGKHPDIKTDERFAMEVQRRWPALTSQSTIIKWCTDWRRKDRASRDLGSQ